MSERGCVDRPQRRQGIPARRLTSSEILPPLTSRTVDPSAPRAGKEGSGGGRSRRFRHDALFFVEMPDGLQHLLFTHQHDVIYKFANDSNILGVGRPRRQTVGAGIASVRRNRFPLLPRQVVGGSTFRLHSDDLYRREEAASRPQPGRESGQCLPSEHRSLRNLRNLLDDFEADGRRTGREGRGRWRHSGNRFQGRGNTPRPAGKRGPGPRLRSRRCGRRGPESCLA